MASYVCPWWAASFTINIPVRRWIHNPLKIVGPYVAPGMTAIDVGCGVGWFTIPMATIVGPKGKVIAVDLQPQMLERVRRRAEKLGLADRITLHNCDQNALKLTAAADFALIFAVLHEVPDKARLLGEVFACLKPGGRLLLAEPPLHVPGKTFEEEVAFAEDIGFRLLERPHVRWSRAALFEKPF